MSAALDDEDLALSINPSYSRRPSSKGAADLQNGSADQSTPRPSAPPPQHRQQANLQKTMQQRLGQYQILKTLGEGTFGKVKLARHHVTGQEVALKIISRRKLMARDMAGRVEREIQYLQLLRHPHIIKLYTVITTQTEIVMVLEYAGSELFNYIVDHGKMQEDKARQFFQQIVCAVEYCHRHKIVHRDLKPENLLLDDHLHVKIADFGLSNIMTDGNFLKTSCGSPNYAAPEVISGKLYAGPEVDVWSCGVILYVLLVGRLPFDDEYIPALFRKIAQGQYHVPNYLSPGAVRLIKKMLQISPVHRITVQEIRQDPWFTKDLPEYLQPPVEEFVDTGVDPNKAIDPRSLAPNKPAAVQDRIHESVIGKLGKTMGYGKEDVQQALAVNEPNAIKDAYLIVRENQMMKETPSLAQHPSLQPFLAQSPPTHATSSPITEVMNTGQTSMTQFSSPGHPEPRSRHGSVQGGVIGDARSPQNTISILPSSLPDYHHAFMRGQPKGQSPQTSAAEASAAADSPTNGPQKQSAEKQAETARRLKPHSRSQMNLERMNRPPGMTPLAQPHKKPKQTKWQFGIRSRNQPAEAMLAIYKALKAMGAEWEVPKFRRPGAGHGSGEDAGSVSGSDGDVSSSEGEYESSQQSRQTDGAKSSRDSTGTASTFSSDTMSSDSQESPARGRRKRRGAEQRYGASNDWGYHIPHDPWIINARFRKDGMYAPGAMHPASAHSSRADLGGESSSHSSGVFGAKGADYGASQDPNAPRSRRSSTMSSSGSKDGISGDTQPKPAAMTENASHTGPAPAAISTGSNPTSAPSSRPGSSKNSRYQLSRETSSSAIAPGSVRGLEADDSAYVYMTIQLYSIEKEFYLVDFKCAGYERLVRGVVREVVREADAGDEDGNDDDDGLDLEDVGRTGMKERIVEREELIGDGRAADEKDVSSPFPFLDVASRLIIQLAEAE